MEKEQVVDGLSTASSSATFYSDCWFWVALVELLFVVTSVIYIRKIGKFSFSRELKKTIKAEEVIDFDNTMMSAFHSQELYNELKVKYHPDRFPNDAEKNELATTLFQQIVENKNNYNRLLEIKEIAQERLK